MITSDYARHRMQEADPVPTLDAVSDDLLAEVRAVIDAGIAGDAGLTSTGPALPAVDRRRRWTRPVIVVAAAFVVTLAVIGAVALLDRGEAPVGDVSTTVPPTVTTIVPETTVAPMVDSWQRVGAEVMEPARGILDMIHTPTGFVAVGFDPSEGDSALGMVFSSPDGVAWSRLADDDPALTDGTVIIYSLTEGGPGFVAGGISCRDAVKPCVVRPTVWTSVDGASWVRSDPDPDTFTDSGAITGVVAIDAGVVAVGNIDETGPDGISGARPAAWFSKDGLEWSRVFVGAGVDNIAVGVAGPHAVEATPDGLLVGVGSAENQAGDVVAAVWASPDGVSWERVAAESFASGTLFNDFAWGSNGFIAVGAVDGGESAIWQSPDGYSWSRYDIGGQPFHTVAALEQGYVAAGPAVNAGGANDSVTLWTSLDGISWNPAQPLAGAFASTIAVTDTGIAVGGGDDQEHAAVWVGPILDPYAPPLDLTPTTTTAAALEEVAVPGPATEWERIESEAFEPGLIWAVASSDETIVAVGEVTYDVVDPADEDGPSGVIWVSNDAVEWTRIDDPEIFGRKRGATIVWDVVARPSGFVASGQDGRNSVLWFSADGYAWQRVFDNDLETPGTIEDLVVGTGSTGWIAAAVEWGPISSPTGVYLISVDGIDWMTVDDPAEAATLDAELPPMGHEWRSPYAFPAAASELMPVTPAPVGGDGAWDYAWNGDQVMAVARNNIPEIWISPDAGVTWYLVDQEQPALDGPYPETQTLGVEFFDGKYVVVGVTANSAAVWHGTWPEPQGD